MKPTKNGMERFFTDAIKHIQPRTRRQRVDGRDQLEEDLILEIFLRVIGSCSNQEIIKHRIC